MKKLFFAAIFLSLFALKLHAQIQIGVRGGVHWSTVRQPTPVINRSLGPGFVVAVPIQVPLTGNWHIRAEPSVIRKGWQSAVDYTTGIGLPAGSGKMVQHYEVAEMSLLVTYRQEINKRFSYYGLLGPSVGYVLGGRLKISDKNSLIFSDQLTFGRRIETGLWGGGGVEMSIWKIVAFLDARYQYGLSLYPPTPKNYASKEATHGFTVSVGCWLPSKK